MHALFRKPTNSSTVLSRLVGDEHGRLITSFQSGGQGDGQGDSHYIMLGAECVLCQPYVSNIAVPDNKRKHVPPQPCPPPPPSGYPTRRYRSYIIPTTMSFKRIQQQDHDAHNLLHTILLRYQRMLDRPRDELRLEIDGPVEIQVRGRDLVEVGLGSVVVRHLGKA